MIRFGALAIDDNALALNKSVADPHRGFSLIQLENVRRSKQVDFRSTLHVATTSVVLLCLRQLAGQGKRLKSYHAKPFEIHLFLLANLPVL